MKSNIFIFHIINKMLAKILIDSLGTFVFTIAVFLSGGNALIIAGTLAIIVYLIFNISGAFVNPAISFAAYIYGGLSFAEFIGYSAGQLIAAAAAAKVYSFYAQ
jgi:glycerol uptake facilitator-like aquaporin